MRKVLVALAFVLSGALLAAGAAVAEPGDVVNGGMPLVAQGKVVAKSGDSLVVRTDDHGHRIAFAVDRRTAMPADLAVGSHVRVVYHARGSTGQAADEVKVEPERRAGR